MREQISDGQCVQQFNDIVELVDHVKATPRKWITNDSETVPPSRSWDDGTGFARSLQMAAEGWPEGVQAISAAMGKLPNGSLPVRRFDVAGDFPDVARYVAGDPRNMVRRGHTHHQRPTMTLVLNVAINAMVTAQELMNYGAAFCSVVDALENRDIRVEVWGIDCAGDRRRNATFISWCVKQSQDVLDLSAVAFSLGHPGMARRIIFAAQERAPCPTIMGYGGILAPRKEDFVDIAEDTIFLAGVGNSAGACKTLKGALALAQAQINKAAGEDLVQLEVA